MKKQALMGCQKMKDQKERGPMQGKKKREGHSVGGGKVGQNAKTYYGVYEQTIRGGLQRNGEKKRKKRLEGRGKVIH